MGDTVDNVNQNMTEAVWCDHVRAKGMWLKQWKVAIKLVSPSSYIVVEERKLKILCSDCFMRAVQLPLF